MLNFGGVMLLGAWLNPVTVVNNLLIFDDGNPALLTSIIHCEPVFKQGPRCCESKPFI